MLAILAPRLAPEGTKGAARGDSLLMACLWAAGPAGCDLRVKRLASRAVQGTGRALGRRRRVAIKSDVAGCFTHGAG